MKPTAKSATWSSRSASRLRWFCAESLSTPNSCRRGTPKRIRPGVYFAADMAMARGSLSRDRKRTLRGRGIGRYEVPCCACVAMGGADVFVASSHCRSNAGSSAVILAWTNSALVGSRPDCHRRCSRNMFAASRTMLSRDGQHLNSDRATQPCSHPGSLV